MEMALGGRYVPDVLCIWDNFFTERVRFAMLVQFGFYSVCTISVYTFILIKVKLQVLERQRMGKNLLNFRLWSIACDVRRKWASYCGFHCVPSSVFFIQQIPCSGSRG